MSPPGPDDHTPLAADAAAVQSVRPERHARLRRAVGYAIGLLLLAAAVVAVASQRRTVAEAWSSIDEAPPLLVAAAFVLPVLSWTFTSTAFWLLTRRFGQIALGEMHALIASAWLLNYLPFRPGLVGRIGYHKAVNGIPAKHSVRVLVESVVLGGTAVGVQFSAALLVRGQGLPTTLAVVAAPLACAAVAAPLLAAVLPAGALAWRYAAAFALKYADTLAWAGRYAVVFMLLGDPIDAASAVLIAAVSQAALLVPLTGNGIGLREWAVGMALPAFSTVASAIALSGDLLNRAVELLIAVPLGLGASAWIAFRLRRRGLRPKDALHAADPDPNPGAGPTSPRAPGV